MQAGGVRSCGFTAGRFRAPPDALSAPLADPSSMRTSYGVVWRDGHKPLARGKLELLPRAIRLDGMSGSDPASREIAYDYLSEVRIGRSPAERIHGRPSLMLEPRTGDTLAIASVTESGVIGEIADRLAALQLGTEGRRRIAVVLPLLEEAQHAVRELLANGPPFEPDALGLDRHQVFLTPSEAVFVFESALGASALEPLLQDPELWQSAAAWSEYLAGPPRIAEDVYSWTRSDFRIDDALLPPGLRNGGSVGP